MDSYVYIHIYIYIYLSRVRVSITDDDDDVVHIQLQQWRVFDSRINVLFFPLLHNIASHQPRRVIGLIVP